MSQWRSMVSDCRSLLAHIRASLSTTCLRIVRSSWRTTTSLIGRMTSMRNYSLLSQHQRKSSTISINQCPELESKQLQLVSTGEIMASLTQSRIKDSVGHVGLSPPRRRLRPSGLFTSVICTPCRSSNLSIAPPRTTGAVVGGQSVPSSSTRITMQSSKVSTNTQLVMATATKICTKLQMFTLLGISTLLRTTQSK